MTEWFEESLYSGWGQRFEVTRVLARETSQFQDILVLETASHGRILVLDGNVQITEADEFIYQEMIAHVPLIAHGDAHRILIIGAGDGGVLRRVLQHRSVTHVTMVEIDEAVIRLSKAFLPNIAQSAWNDGRANVIVGDGIAHVAASDDDTYDVIIIDSTDPIGVGETLFTTAFYAHCARILRPGGLVVNQSGVPFMQADELTVTSRRRAESFRYVSAYVAAVPTYVGGLMAFGISSNEREAGFVGLATLQSRGEKAGLIGATRYWTPSTHYASFQLPPYISDCLPKAQ